MHVLIYQQCCTHSKLPGSKPPLKDTKVVNEQAATKGVLDI